MAGTPAALALGMSTLLGVFSTRAQAEQARRQAESAGFRGRILEEPVSAGSAMRRADSGGAEGESAASAVGATLGGLTTLGVGAVPGAWLGKLVGDWLSADKAQEYERAVREGSVALLVEAPDTPASARAQAEEILRRLGATNVHTGEVPRA